MPEDNNNLKAHYTVYADRTLLDDFRALCRTRGESAAEAIRGYMIRTLLNNEETDAEEVG